VSSVFTINFLNYEMSGAMSKCPACGIVVDATMEKCVGCGTILKEVTLSFPPVSPDRPTTRFLNESKGPALVVSKGPEVGERFGLKQSAIVIGRDPASDIFLNDVTVSRNHALIRASGEKVTITDSGSLNGTYVDGILVDEAVLGDGDIVQIGRFQMVFVAGD